MNPLDKLSNGLSNNWTLIASVMVAIAPMPAALHKLGSTVFNLRSSLKEDLEILKLLDPADPSYKTLKSHIDQAIAEKYGHAPSVFSVFNWPAFLMGLAGCVFMVTWTIKLRAIGYNYWPWVTGLAALLFFNQFASGFREVPKSAKPDPEPRRKSPGAPFSSAEPAGD